MQFRQQLQQKQQRRGRKQQRPPHHVMTARKHRVPAPNHNNKKKKRHTASSSSSTMPTPRVNESSLERTKTDRTLSPLEHLDVPDPPHLNDVECPPAVWDDNNAGGCGPVMMSDDDHNGGPEQQTAHSVTTTPRTSRSLPPGSWMKRKHRSATVLPTTKPTAHKKVKVFSARPNITTSHGSTTTTSTTAFLVPATPPQFVALVEGICHDTAAGSLSHGSNESYYASQRYHYLLDIVDHHQHQGLPHQGYATELPCVAPAAPGPWMVQVLTKDDDRDTSTMLIPATHPIFFRSHQADWNGDRIRLVHADFQCHVRSSVDDVEHATCQRHDLTMVRIDPNRYRAWHMTTNDDDDGACDDNHVDTHPNRSNSFVGAMGIVLFDGFASVSERDAGQASLARAVLDELRHILEANQEPEVQHATPMMVGGGIVIPINVGDPSPSLHHHHMGDGSDYYLLLFICDATNQVVAVDSTCVPLIVSFGRHSLLKRFSPHFFLVPSIKRLPLVVFDNISVNGTSGKYLNGANDSPATTEVVRTPPLTHQNLQKHTSTWSATNMLQRFWKTKKDSPSPVDDQINKMSTTMLVDEWTPHDDLSVATTVKNNDMDIVRDRDDAVNLKHYACSSEQAAVRFVPSNEAHERVPQDICLQVTTDLPSATPVTSFPVDPVDEPFVTLNHQPLQVSMMNQITPTPLQEQSLHLMTNVDHVHRNLERKALFPESRLAKDDGTTKGDFTCTVTSKERSIPFVAPPELHRSALSGTTENEDPPEKNAPTLSPSQSTGSTFVDFLDSIYADPAQNDDEVIQDANPSNFVDAKLFDLQNNDDADSTPSWMDQFGAQNADSVPEMTTIEIATWCSDHHAMMAHWPTTDSNWSLVGWSVLDPDDETFRSLCCDHWVWPIVTLVAAFFLFYGIVMENQFLMNHWLVMATTNWIPDDPSQGLLAPLRFVGTDFGYVGVIRVE